MRYLVKLISNLNFLIQIQIEFWLKFFNSNQNSHFFQLSFSILEKWKFYLLNNIFIINLLIEFVIVCYKLKKMNRKKKRIVVVIVVII